MSKKPSKPYLSRRWCHCRQISRETGEQCCEPPAYQPRSLSLTRICWWTCLPSPRWSDSWIPHRRNVHGRKNHAVVHHPRFLHTGPRQTDTHTAPPVSLSPVSKILSPISNVFSEFYSSQTRKIKREMYFLLNIGEKFELFCWLEENNRVY